MNKKSLILLPALMMILASCGGSTSDASSEEKPSSETPSSAESSSGDSTTSVDPSVVNYGTAENPLTVASFNTEVAKLGLDETTNMSTEHFYVKGLAKTVPSFNSTYSSYMFTLSDSKEADGIKVTGAKLDTGVEEPYQNDTVVVCGLAELYQEAYCIYYTDTDSPAIKSVTRGTSTVTKTIEHGTITGLEDSYANGATATFTVTPESGYKVSLVKAGDATLTEAEGTYSFVVKGDTAVVVTLVDESSTEKVADVALSGTLFTLASDKESATYTTEGVEFTLDKKTSTTAISLSSTDQLRIYNNAGFTIKLSGIIKKIVFTSGPSQTYSGKTTEYYPNLIGATFTGGTVDADASSKDDLIVVVNADADVSEVSFAAAAGQVRLTHVVITYEPAA